MKYLSDVRDNNNNNMFKDKFWTNREKILF